MYFTESLGEGQITLTDPADLPQDLAECPGQDGRTKQIRIMPSQSKLVGTMAAAPLARASSLGASHPVHTPICPHRPQVPIPELMGAPFISSPNTQVAMGPVMAEASVGGIQIRGFFTMLGI